MDELEEALKKEKEARAKDAPATTTRPANGQSSFQNNSGRKFWGGARGGQTGGGPLCDRRCYNCGLKGHFIRDCKQAKTGGTINCVVSGEAGCSSGGTHHCRCGECHWPRELLASEDEGESLNE